MPEWVEFSKKEQLLKSLQPGDRIEFDRGVYCHWAIFIGLDYQNGSTYYKIAHRTHPTYADNEIPIFMIASTSIPSSTQSLGGGAIRYDDILHVWTKGRARKNNSLDSKYPPRHPDKILAMIEAMIDNPSQNGYNLLKDNCEHFANVARNDTSTSQQVDRGLSIASIVGGTLVGVFGAIAIAKAINTSKESDDEEEPTQYRYGR
ncbi:phospholipase A and acyltransferase 2-like [Tigriopus californicus]|uniref:phospholipase A and acyltransferase 2-like n=1 Tax=Tigriopus californicus TaxID=6832 RepID=UPI0027DA175E|nr:phospholipase A and acyltransferase 2-like [Tigriopus californicus]